MPKDARFTEERGKKEQTRRGDIQHLEKTWEKKSEY